MWCLRHAEHHAKNLTFLRGLHCDTLFFEWPVICFRFVFADVLAIGVFIDVAFSILPGIRTAPICGGSSSLLQYSGMLQMAVHRLNSNGVLLRNWFHAFWKLENSTQCSKCFLAMGTQNDPPLLSTVWLNIRRVVLKATPYWILYDVSRTHKQCTEP